MEHRPFWWTDLILAISVLLHFAFVAIYCVDANFVIYEISMERDGAKNHCLTQGHAGLAVLDTRAKMDAVLALSNYQVNKDYWVGLMQANTTHPLTTTFVWDSANAVPWAAWNSIEPNNLNSEFCVRIRANLQELANMRCDRLYYFVCQDSYGDSTTATGLLHGNYPVIHADQSLQTAYPGLERFSGTTRSEIGCVIICAQDSECGYVIFTTSNRMCTAYSQSLKDESYSLQPRFGTNIRRKIT